MSVSEQTECVRFVPSHVEGLPDVTEVARYPNRREVKSAGQWTTIELRKIAREKGSAVWQWAQRLLGKSTRSPVADRDWFHPPPEGFFVFSCTPPLRICMREDVPNEYGNSYSVRIQEVILMGGVDSFDLG